MTLLTITQPDDWHIHLRDGAYLKTTVSHAARQFQRIIVMPNLSPPVTTTAAVKTYYDAIVAAIPSNRSLLPLMTLYLTSTTTPAIIEEAYASKLVFGCKLYPAGSTTNSSQGVSSVMQLFSVFAKMQELNLPLLIHGEVTDPNVDIFDREAYFLETHLSLIIKEFPHLRIVLEHITTQEAVQYVLSASENLAATITAHHLLLNRNDLLVGGIKPHHFCLPILKRRYHQEALIQAAISGSPKFFIGTDSAPHAQRNKESNCGCAGIYSAHAAIEFYAQAFEQANALDKLEGFCSFYGADFYRLPRNSRKITLMAENWQIPPFYPYGNTQLIPFRAGTLIPWKLM